MNPFPNLLRKWGERFLNLLYPPHCAFCQSATRSGNNVVCDLCLQSAVRIYPPACDICCTPGSGTIERARLPDPDEAAHGWDDWDDWDDSLPEHESEKGSLLSPARSTGFTCPPCRTERPLYDSALTPFRSRAVVREAIHRFKYNGDFHFLPLLGEWLALVVDDPVLQTTPPDAIVPVPLHPTRQRARGFNQAHLLATHLGQKMGLPVLNALRRTRYTPSQTRFARAKRMENLRNAFELRQTANVRNLNLLLVDDVLTTGSTVNACASPLKKVGGAATVRVAAVARG